MKIKKIAIHNIATITDCVLDTERQPLSTADLVLICGETGSGKTTILDAICLALYGKTPRMEDTDMTARRGQGAVAEATGLGMDDVRQMMTTGTTEAWALMSFSVKDGSTDRVYTAGWYCSCDSGRTLDAFIKGVSGRKGRNSGYRDAANFLVCGDAITETGTIAVRDGKDVTDKHVREEVKRIVGLDFNQFCRTTMLAQGQFSKFYKSSEADKAVILEKILGKNVYSRVGKRIYEKTRDHKNVWELLNDRLGSLKPITEDERQAIAAAIAEQGAIAARAAEQCRDIDTRLTWLSNDKDIKASLTAAAECKAAAEEALTTPEYTAAAAQVTLYDDAASVINLLRETQGNKKRDEDCRNTLAMCSMRLNDAARNIERQSMRLQADIAQLHDQETDYAGRAHRRKVFEWDKEFVEALNVIIMSDSTILKQKALLDQKVKDEEVVREAQVEAEERLKVAQKAEDDAAKAVKVGEKNLAALNPEEVNATRTCQATLRGRLLSLRTAVEELQARQNEAAEIEKASGKYKDDIAQIIEAIERIDPVIETADKVLKTAEEAFTLANIAAGNDLDRLRARLEVGCTCPLCRQTINHELPQRSDLVDEANAMKEQKTKAQKNLDELRDRRNALVRKKSTAEEMCRRLEQSLQKAKTDINVRQDAITQAVNDLKIGAPDVSAIDDKIEALDQDIRRTEKTLQTVSEVGKQLEALRKVAERCADVSGKAREKYAQCDNKLTEITADIKHIRQTLKDAEAAKDGAQVTASSIDPERIFGDLHEAPGQDVLDAYLAARLEDNKQKEAIDSQRHNVEMRSRALGEIQALYARAKDALPEDIPDATADGDSSTAADTTASDVSLDSLNLLMSKIIAAKSALDEIANKAEACEAALQEYLRSHEDCTRELLMRLAAIDPREIRRLRNMVDEARQKAGEARARLAEAQRRVAEHGKAAGNAPLADIEGDETSETVKLLQAAKTEWQQRRDTANSEKGKLNERLEADDTLRREHRALLERVAQAKAEYDKWSRLNHLFGDANGDRFRLIALSFVLESLLERANIYLHKLTPQYDLVGVRGTLNINIRDIGRGGVIRSGNTPSGGETFLVSLALSLALSEISDRLAVDTLFIDEGFGTLSGQPLHNAVALLQSLQRDTCRRVVLISHNADLREMIPAQIRLSKDPYTCTSTMRTIVMS